jgi:hypothetical protein
MTMKKKSLESSRRQFLRGAAGFTLALPFLESLASKDAVAGDPPFAANGRFVCMTTQHGGVWGENMWPSDNMLTGTQNVYSGHAARHGALTPTVNGSRASLSPVLTADASQLTSDVAAKMMLLRGFDVPWYLGHHTGGDLGNFASEFDFIGENSPIQEHRATMDQVMAYSSSFHPDVSSIRMRSMHVGTHTHHSWGHANPTTQSGGLQPTPLSQSAMTLFNQIFVPPEVEDNPRPLVVDRVLRHYQMLRQGRFGDAARLSSHDAERLDSHMDRLRDLQTRLNAVADCSSVPPLSADTNGLDVGGYSSNINDARTYYQLYNDVIAAAFICGTSRIAIINSGETWSTEHPGLCCDWHQLVAHEAHNPAGVQQQIMVAAKQRFFEWVFMDLVNKLNVEEANGVTYLDNTLVMWTEESGATTHDAVSKPLICAGSGTGYFDTGQYVDFRNRNNTALENSYSPEHMALRPGIPYQRFLANALMAMNVQPSEFEAPGERGFGFSHTNDTEAWPAHYLDDSSDPLPLVTS